MAEIVKNRTHKYIVCCTLGLEKNKSCCATWMVAAKLEAAWDNKNTQFFPFLGLIVSHCDNRLQHTLITFPVTRCIISFCWYAASQSELNIGSTSALLGCGRLGCDCMQWRIKSKQKIISHCYCTPTNRRTQAHMVEATLHEPHCLVRGMITELFRCFSLSTIIILHLQQ